MNVIPVRIATMPADWPSDDACDYCCSTPVRTEFDGEKFCQACADKWVRNEQPEVDEDELRHALRRAGPDRAAMIEARLEDAELTRLSKIHRQHERTGL